jgi:hypothetical protein
VYLNGWAPTPDPIADRYRSEFYGFRLLRLKRGTASPDMIDGLLKAVWPVGSDGARLFRVGGENQENWIDLERDHIDFMLAYEETRQWLQDTLIPRFIDEQERKCGSLEAAVAAGRGRLLKKWVSWRFRDDLRRRFRVSSELALERLPTLEEMERQERRRERALWGDVDVWALADAAGLSTQDREVLELFRDGVGNRDIGSTFGCGGEANVRKCLKRLHSRLGLPLPPRRRGRPRSSDEYEF